MTKLRVHFHTLGDNNLGSHRMRASMPANCLKWAHGKYIEPTYGPNLPADAQIVVFSKHFDPDGVSFLVFKCKSRGVKVVYDICDDHFDRAAGPFYEWMCDQADHITCSSSGLQTRIYEVTGKLASIIPDPLTVPMSPPKYMGKPATELQYVWFGHGSNLPAILNSPWLKEGILGPDNFTIISNVQPMEKVAKFVPWSPDLLERTLADYDVAVVPALPFDYAQVKSPNRRNDAIYAGLPFITDNRNIYAEDGLKACIFAPNLNEAVRLAYEITPDEFHRDQEILMERFGLVNVAKLWLQNFQQIMKG